MIHLRCDSDLLPILAEQQSENGFPAHESTGEPRTPAPALVVVDFAGGLTFEPANGPMIELMVAELDLRFQLRRH